MYLVYWRRGGDGDCYEPYGLEGSYYWGEVVDWYGIVACSYCLWSYVGIDYGDCVAAGFAWWLEWLLGGGLG